MQPGHRKGEGEALTCQEVEQDLLQMLWCAQQRLRSIISAVGPELHGFCADHMAHKLHALSTKTRGGEAFILHGKGGQRFVMGPTGMHRVTAVTGKRRGGAVSRWARLASYRGKREFADLQLGKFEHIRHDLGGVPSMAERIAQFCADRVCVEA